MAAAGIGEMYIIEAVLVELCTVLEFNPRFGLSRTLIYSSLSALFARQAISLAPKALEAFELYQKYPKLDIVDCLLAACSGQTATKVLTFDNDLQKILR